MAWAMLLARAKLQYSWRDRKHAHTTTNNPCTCPPLRPYALTHFLPLPPPPRSQSECVIFDCDCKCDLTAGVCDMNCCCDTECTASQVRIYISYPLPTSCLTLALGVWRRSPSSPTSASTLACRTPCTKHATVRMKSARLIPSIPCDPTTGKDRACEKQVINLLMCRMDYS